MAAGTLSPMLRRLVPLLLASAVLAGCGGGGAEPGTVVTAPPIAGYAPGDFAMQLPVGKVGANLSAPIDDLPVDDAGDTPRQVVDDGAWVRLVWSFTTADAEARLRRAYDQAALPAEPVKAELVAGEERVELPPPYTVEDGRPVGRARNTVYVAVPKGLSQDDIALELTYDGETQRRTAAGDLSPGRAAVFYDADELRPPECLPNTFGGQRDDPATPYIDCVVTAFTTPWVARYGWAEEGDLWLLVEVAAQAGPESANHRDYAYAVRGEQGSATLDGEAPVAELDRDFSRESGMSIRRYLFAVDADDTGPVLQMEETFAVQITGGGLTKPRDAPFTLENELVIERRP